MSSMKATSQSAGKTYWRSLNELAETPEYRNILEREFPENAAEMKDPVTRREFLSLMGASAALAGLTGCRKPMDYIVPYVNQPEEVVPGIPLEYASTMPLGEEAYGLVVTANEGRPTKIEGNAQHPDTQGAANSFMLASILNLYDPDRTRRTQKNGVVEAGVAGWPAFVGAWAPLKASLAANGGSGLAVLSESLCSPTAARVIREFQAAFPQAKWVTYEPVSNENIYAGVNAATGAARRPLYHFDKADVVLALDCDFLLMESGNVRHAKEFSRRRRVKNRQDSMNRVYAVEGVYSLTGGVADHRLRLRSTQIGAFAAALARELEQQGLNVAGADAVGSAGGGIDPKWLKAAAQDLRRAGSKGLVVAGRRQPAAVHALACSINAALGATGTTVTYVEPRDSFLSDRNGLQQLVADINGGSVDTLVVLGGDPVYNAPADLDFAAAMKKVKTSIQLSPLADATSRLATWHIPQSHFLESWGDARAADGSLSVTQPLIAPLHESRSIIEFVHFLATGEDLSVLAASSATVEAGAVGNGGTSMDLVKTTWQEILGASGFAGKWRRVLHDGILSDSAYAKVAARIEADGLSDFLRSNPVGDGSGTGMEIVFQASPSVLDGRYGNNGWMQELPDTVTKLTWDNAALLSPATAAALGVRSEDVLQLSLGGRQVELPAWIVPGHADETVTVELGYGQNLGRVSEGAGASVYTLRTSQDPDMAVGVQIEKTGRTYALAGTQDHHSMKQRALLRETTLEEYRRTGEFHPELVHAPHHRNMWKAHDYSEGYQWGMAIDLTTCIGCNACTLACQSENNIPVVGKAQVKKGREMHWIRVDRYFKGDVDDPEMRYQPVPCMHCENAPCEQVCPVAATVHDREGLNVMVYNRCIGTRYCANNCPFKVRRFNFFNYTKTTPELRKMGNNPDVTVRSRGVMEKCTYCVQRINRAKIRAKQEDRGVRDGEIQTACQQACPVDAIFFGDINGNNGTTEVQRQKASDRNYQMLEEFNLRVRTSYLGEVRNPNPELHGT